MRETKHKSHVTRGSDSSLYDEVCVNCGATDITGGGWGRLAEPCPKAKPTLKYEIGTKFHTYESIGDGADLNYPMHGLITDIRGDKYTIRWIYEKTDGDFSATYTEGGLQDVIDHFGNNSRSFAKCRIELPEKPLPEDLFTI